MRTHEYTPTNITYETRQLDYWLSLHITTELQEARSALRENLKISYNSAESVAIREAIALLQLLLCNRDFSIMKADDTRMKMRYYPKRRKNENT